MGLQCFWGFNWSGVLGLLVGFSRFKGIPGGCVVHEGV